MISYYRLTVTMVHGPILYRFLHSKYRSKIAKFIHPTCIIASPSWVASSDV